MNPEILRLLAKAVGLQESIKDKKESHAELVKTIKTERATLFRSASDFTEGSLAEQEVCKKIDLLDQKEFSAHERFRNFLKLADKELQKTIREIVEQKFGPDWDSD